MDKELHGPGNNFPVAVAKAPSRHDAYQFTNEVNTESSKSFSFGMNREKTAEALREIANRIESGEYILQSGYVLTYAKLDDYAMSVVQVKFHARRVR